MIEAIKHILLPSILHEPGRAILHRAIVRVSGSDSLKFINGLSTNAVSLITPSSGQYNLFLSSQGRMLFDSFVWRIDNAADPNEFLIEVDHRVGQDLYYHFKQFQLRSRLQIEDVSGKFGLSVHWGCPSSAKELSLVDPRGELGLIRELHNSPLPSTNESAYKALRFALGIPEGPVEIPRTQAMPLEYNLDFLGGISYQKGCYLGQELVARTHHRGTIRKRLLPVLLSREPILTERIFDPAQNYETATQDGELYTSSSMEEKAVGKLISTHGNLGLALMRLEAVSPERSYSLPNHGLHVKPFIPNWLSKHIS